MGKSVQFCAALLACLAPLLTAPTQASQEAWSENSDLIVVVGAPFVELHLFPGRGYPKFHAVEKHQRLRILKKRTDWYQVEAETGHQGWIHRNDLHSLYDPQGHPVAFAAPTWHDASRNPWHTGLLTGELDGAVAYTLYGGYRFTPHLAAEMRYTQAFGDFSHSKLGSMRLVHQAFPRWRVSPYFALGAGMIQVRPDAVLVQAEDREDVALSVGGGLMLYLSHSLAVRLEYTKHTVLTTRPNNEEVEEWQAGFSVLF